MQKNKLIIFLPVWQISWLKNHADGLNISIDDFISKVMIGDDSIDGIEDFKE